MAKFSINLKDGSVEQEQPIIIGIDLGTTNSLVAYMRDGQPHCVRDAAGKSALLPSVVHFNAEAEVVVGEQAKEKLIADPANTIYSVKRLMGKSYQDVAGLQGYFGYKILDEDPEALVKIRVKNQFFTPIELSANILRELKRRVETELQTTLEKVVITVPAYFNDSQRQATRDAGKLAGFDVLRIVNEPTAAALAYGIGLDPETSETIAVYDLGGGTFDISILRIQNGIFEVLATNGDTFLGGDDFDRALTDLFLKQLNIGAEKLAEDKSLGQAIRLLAERAKKSLSSQTEFQGELLGKRLLVNRAAFEHAIRPLAQRTIEHCRQALADAGKKIAEIDKIILVGGSTRVPLVREMVAGFFGKPGFDSIDPDEVVALGAAVQADILAGNQKNLLLLDVTPLSLGIETVGGLMDTIIPRNTKVPAKAGRQYTTSVDGQKNLKIAVFQGERDLVEHNRKLGEFILRNIPPMPAGLPKIDITFLINADGILTVRAAELRSGVQQEIDIRPSYGISEEEMARMLLDSIAHAQEDMQARGLLEARNEANNLLLAGVKFLEQNKDLLSDPEKLQTKNLLSLLEKAVKGEDKDSILHAIETLNAFTTPLAHRAMDRTIQAAMHGKQVSGK
ncbi:MAG: Fe-S protein assembly chaperone HscA [Saprospiraceae bacterium]|nr:Fe-S protein assembly chaperone HscA [Saprospiraceae bacterium]